MKTLLVILALSTTILALPALAAQSQATPQAGVNYKVLDDPQPTTAPAGKTEVIEFFWYACPHCFALQPYLKNWLKHGEPKNVDFVRVPVPTGFRWGKVYAHAFYTEKALGLVDKLHNAIFNEIHVKHHMLKSKEDFKKFFAKHGVNNKTFDNTWDSFTVAMNVKQAAHMQKAYHIMGVPTIAVDGRYTATLHGGQGDEDLLGVANFLIKKVQTNTSGSK